MSGTLSLLRIPDIRTLLTARFISMFGSAATVLAVQLLVLDRYGLQGDLDRVPNPSHHV